MKITAILRSRGSSQRVTVKFDDGSSIVLPLEVAMTSHLGRGKELDEQRVQALQSEAERWRCRETALRLIGFRARSGKELRGRLLQRGFTASVVEESITHLLQTSLLNDEVFACAFANDRLRSRPVGRTRLLYELRAKGIDEETARKAIEQAYAAADPELELARRAARRFRRRPGEEEIRAKRRLLGMLSRRGFSRDTIRTIVSELIG